MLRKIALLTVILTVFAAVNAFADSCATGNFVGTYTRSAPAPVTPDGEITHTFVFQLTLHADGTATESWTGFPDYQTNLGTGSTYIGAWKCRDNGNLLVTVLNAGYEPIAPGDTTLPFADVRLAFHTRSTYVFEITNNNTITRIKLVRNTFGPDQDPTDPNVVGSLGALNTTPVVYKRIEASAADLH